MTVTTIRGLAQFDSLKEHWNAAYQADTQATFCMSWDWLRGWLEVTPHEWFVLALRPGGNSAYVAFLPLATASGYLFMAGTPLADYTGFVCRPEYEDRALEAWAKYMNENLRWQTFVWTNSMDGRAEAFLRHFSSKRFVSAQSEVSPCPYIELPATWESYLTECLGPKTGKCLRRSLRAIEERGEYCLTQADGASLEPHLEALLSKWHSRWGLPEYYKEGFRQVMRQAHFQGTLSLHCIWDGDKLIGSTSGFLEPERKTFTACLTTSDRSYTNLRPGKVAYLCSIRHAIEQGCRIYDFTQGGEDYKYSLGAVTRMSPSYTLIRRTCMMTVKEVRNKLEAMPGIGRLVELTHFRKLKERLIGGVARLLSVNWLDWEVLEVVVTCA